MPPNDEPAAPRPAPKLPAASPNGIPPRGLPRHRLVGWLWPEERELPRPVALVTFMVSGNIAAMHATLKALGGELNPIWEPTRRKTVETD